MMEVKYGVLELSVLEPYVFEGVSRVPFRPQYLLVWPLIESCSVASVKIGGEEQLMMQAPLSLVGGCLRGVEELHALLRRANEIEASPFHARSLLLPTVSAGMVMSVSISGEGLEGVAFWGIEPK